MKYLPVVSILCEGGYLQCTTYLIEGPDGLIMIDPGSGIAEDAIVDALDQKGYRLNDIEYALLTHCHVDHTLGAYRLLEHGSKLVASPQTAAILRSGGHQVWYEFPEYVIPTEVALTVEHGSTLNLCGIEIDCIATPGHTGGSMSYALNTSNGRTIFTGDLLGDTNPGWAGSDTFSEENTIASMRKLMSMQPERVCWGHGIISEPPQQWLQKALDRGLAGEWHLEKRQHKDDVPPPSFRQRGRT